VFLAERGHAMLNITAFHETFIRCCIRLPALCL
jgi:hypothetical protein